MPVAPQHAPLAGKEAAAGGTVLLVIDMFSTWDFPNGGRMAARANAIAPRIAALKRRAGKARVPTVYVNDNDGHWRSDFRQLVERSAVACADAAEIARTLAPAEVDYAVLKPKHSGFFATPLDLLLRHLRAKRLIVTGTTTDQCVVVTAVDARMRDYDVVVPSDTAAAATARRHATALATLREVHGLRTPASARLELP